MFFLANVAEVRNQPEQALDLYMKTADLAEDSNPQLTVVAKMRYGMLLQQLNYSMGPAPTEIPSEATSEATPEVTPAGTPAAPPESTTAP